MNGGIYKCSNTNRFASADTLIPDPANPQSYNRYSYTYNNPLILVDPSGHCPGYIENPVDCQMFDLKNGVYEGDRSQNHQEAVRVVNTINFWANTASSYPLLVASNYKTVVSAPVPGITPRGVKTVTPYRAAATGLAHVGPAVTGLTSAVTISDRVKSGQITEFEAALEHGANVGMTLGNIGGTIAVGEGAGLVAGKFIGGASAANWVFGATVIGTISLAYDVEVIQGTVNNMIEGNSFSEAFFDARISAVDSYFGEGTQQNLDAIIDFFWPEAIDERIADTFISILAE